MLLTKTAATQKELALSYDRMRELYFLAVVFVVTIGYYVKTVNGCDEVFIRS